MKAFLASFLVLCCVPTLHAQTITLQPLAKLAYCIGDTLKLNYSATGTFGPGNFFFAELSDANGSFNPQNIIGMNTTDTGSFQIVLSTRGIGYRVRVVSDTPFIVSADNGQDISVSLPPVPTPSIEIGEGRFSPVADSISGVAVLEGEPAHFIVTSFPLADTFQWLFLDDASINSITGDSASVTYSSPGLKTGYVTTITKAGCENSIEFTIRVLDCDPIIPLIAENVADSESSDSSFVWVHAGGFDTVQGIGYPQTFFIDSGGTVYISSDAEWNTYYVQPGGQILPHLPERGTEVFGAGVRDTFEGFAALDTLSCPSLAFHVQSGVSITQQVPSIRAVQIGDRLEIFSNDGIAEVHLFSALGTEIYSSKGMNEFDLSSLPNGIYFAEVRSGSNSLVTKIALIR